jgi:quercetin dioxygenase-like cupin family protein
MNKTVLTALLPFLLTSLVFGQATKQTNPDTEWKKAADPLFAAKNNYSLVFENDRVRVLRFHVGPGARLEAHGHPNAVVISLSEFDSRNAAPGKRSATRRSKTGEARWEESTAHMVENVGATEMDGLMIELKSPAATNATPSADWVKAADPLKAEPGHYALEFENKLVRVLGFVSHPGEKWVAHRHPDGVHVSLSEYDLRNVVPGNAATEAHRRPGEARWVPAVIHTGENIGTTDMRSLIIELK